MKILVIGATGNLGRHTVRQALEAGLKVRAASRHPEKLAYLGASGVEVVHADLIDPESVTRACAGIEGVVATAHSLLGSGKYRSSRVDGVGNQTLVEAARRTGVRHLVFVSSVGAAPTAPVEQLRTKFAVEEHIRDSGVDHTILRPSAFMESHAHQFIGAPLLKSGRVVIPGSGRNAINLIAAADVARYVLISLTDPRASNRVLEVGGWDNRTKDDIARTYARLANITPKIRHLPSRVLRTGSHLLQPVRPGVADALRLLHWADTTRQTMDPTRLQEEFPFEMVRLDDFIEQDTVSLSATAT